MSRGRLRGRAGAVGAVAAALLLLTVIVVVRSRGDGPATAALPRGEAHPRSLAFGRNPLWDERTLGMTDVDGAELRGGAAVVTGRSASAGRLVVADARTGTIRWSADGGDPLLGGDGALAYDGPPDAEGVRGLSGGPVLVDADTSPGGWSVIVQYAKGADGEERGVAALSGEDGRVLWKQALFRGADDDREQETRLLAADGRVVLAGVRSAGRLRLRTVAFDAAAGRRLWEHQDGWAFRIDGGTVLGESAEGEPWRPREVRDGAAVFGLDLMTGRKRWDLAGAFEGAHVQAAAGGTAAVTVRERIAGGPSTRFRTMALDSATGRVQVASLEAEEAAGTPGPVLGCVDDRRTLIACAAYSGRLVTIRPGGRPFTAKKPLFKGASSVEPDLVWRDRVLASRALDGNRRAGAVADRAANGLGATPPGRPAALSDRFAALLVRRGLYDGLAVYGASETGKPEEPAPVPSSQKPLRVEARPLWTAKADTIRGVSSAVLDGDAVLISGTGPGGSDDRRHVVADARTGETRWTRRAGDSLGGGDRVASLGLPRLAHVGGETLSLVKYEGQGSQGIAALSLRDGRVRWKKAVAGDGVNLYAVGDATFAVRVTDYGAGAGGGGERERTVAFATSTRRELWRRSGVVPELDPAGDLVIAARLGKAERYGVEPHTDLIAYGASDGRQRWRTGGRYRDPRLQFAGGSALVVTVGDGAAVLDRATGRELARTGARLGGCGGTGALVVCRTGEGDVGGAGEHAVTIEIGDGTARINDLPRTAGLTAFRALGPWLTATRPAAPGGGRPAFPLLDAAGRTLAEDLPGAPLALGGGLAVLTTPGPDGAAALSVYRVRG
ncbi:PQQ-binding-like beta-propeller repeat protein [Actinomadura sp. NEAU-AAG7]|uniref:outer membrane protein assembly factor BamB family protein n=1 Tax=Actinomadura sp. NEAU-AAG7 TaxID=2839640 RepID=UPI001BE45FFF|nr:PQQ-binding-like beta-propeller repeat protein [Actinomadura sp. NEAU-AAG7]MBT2208867.1 PQQ-binding-like beta-propeller repeat protein [Actinomadura sp. NEAU-AAG7]